MSRHVALIAMAALALGGCVSLLPQSPPAQLYRFGADDAAEPAMAQPSGPGVILAEVAMPAASTGDQILTVTGERAAYIAQARWVTPAVQMLREDAERSFANRARRVRLLHRGEIAVAGALLRLDVDSFEARYDDTMAATGAGRADVAPPMVIVSLRASLTRSDGEGLQQRTFTVRRRASENRVSAIVSAFDAATASALDQTVAWTDASTPEEPAAPVTDVTTTTTTTKTKTKTSPR